MSVDFTCKEAIFPDPILLVCQHNRRTEFNIPLT